MKQKSTGIFTR